MTICRYYLQGNCRFGDRCRFEHSDPDYSPSEGSHGRSNRRQDYGYQDRYRQQEGHQSRHSNYQDPDLSYGPRRYDNYEKQNQRFGSEKYVQREHFESDSRFGQHYQQDSHERNNQRSNSDKYYSNQRHVSPNNNRNDNFQKQHHHSSSDYPSNKHNRNQYEWVSEDYKRRQQQVESSNDVVNKSYSTNRVAFSFKDSSADVNEEEEKNLILAENIKEEVTAWELGNQWPLTCYFPFPDKPGFPGFNDVSFEELRYEALKARENNSFNSYVESVQKAILDVNSRRNQLKVPNNSLLLIIKKLRAGEHLSNESQVGGGFSLTNFNQSTTDDIIADDSPVHTHNPAASFSFKSVFDKETTPASSSASSFSFKLPENEKVASTLISTTTSDSEIYTPMDVVSEPDKQQFSASTFTLGKIPTVPPPKMMCF